jgi:transmembrane 9 superfamily protein 2/4
MWDYMIKDRFTMIWFLFDFNRIFAGYVSGRIYKTMKGQQWKKAAFQVS